MTANFEIKNTFLNEAREEVAPSIQRSTTEPITHLFHKQLSSDSCAVEDPMLQCRTEPTYLCSRMARLNTGDSLGSSMDGILDGTKDANAATPSAGLNQGQPSILSRMKTFDAMEDDILSPAVQSALQAAPMLPVILGHERGGNSTLQGENSSNKRNSLPAVREQSSSPCPESDEEEEEEETRATSSFNTITTTGTRRQHVFRHSDTFNHFDPPDEMDPSLAALLPPMMSHTNSEMTMGSVNSEVMMGNVSSEVTMSSVNSFNMGRMASLHSMDNLAPMPQANSMPNLNNNNNNNMMAGGGSDSMGNFVIQANSMPNLPMMATVPSMSHPMSNMTGVPCTNGTMTGMNNMGSFNNMNTQVSYNMTPCPGMPMSIPIATADKSDHTVTLTPPPHPPVDSQGSTQPPSMISTSSLSIPMMDPNSGSEGALDSDNSPRVGRTPSTGTPPEGVPKTTLMLRNLPRCYTQSLLVTLLENEGFTPEYDFLYLPVDFKSHSALGYAFINAVDEESALRMYKHFNNFTKWGVPSNKKCSVGWSYKSMGLDANVQRYRNSPVMHPSVPTHYQPIRRLNGKLIPFEEPTKTIKPPRQGTQLVLP